MTDDWGNDTGLPGCVPAGLYSVWDDQTESWVIEPTTLERAQAFAQTRQKQGYRTSVVAGYAGEYNPVFDLAAFKRQTDRAAQVAAQDAADSARRAATVASIAAQAAPAPIAPSADQRRANLLAANQANLTAELAKRKPDQAEVDRLRANIAKLAA